MAWAKPGPGRPKGSMNKKRKLFIEDCAKYTGEMLDILVAVARDPNCQQTSRIKAAEIIITRGQGKPFTINDPFAKAGKDTEQSVTLKMVREPKSDG